MRITGGNWRGRKLAEIGEGDKAAHLRPASDRLRETVFNIIGQEKFNNAPQDMRVLDLFAGSGSYGFEALSRGANYACFVDSGATARALIRANISDFKSGGKAKLLRRDACELGMSAEGSFDLIFMDPPYSQSLGEKAIASAIGGGWIDNGSLIIWEEERPPLAPSSLQILDQRKVGRAILSIFRYQKKN